MNNEPNASRAIPDAVAAAMRNGLPEVAERTVATIVLELPS